MTSKHTPGPWKLASDAQGPCMVMHPTLKGVAIASLTDAFKPMNGFHSPTVDEPKPCPEVEYGTTYRPERVANARLIAAAPELLDALENFRDYFINCFDYKEAGAASMLGLVESAIAKAGGDHKPPETLA